MVLNNDAADPIENSSSSGGLPYSRGVHQQCRRWAEDVVISVSKRALDSVQARVRPSEPEEAPGGERDSFAHLEVNICLVPGINSESRSAGKRCENVGRGRQRIDQAKVRVHRATSRGCRERQKL